MKKIITSIVAFSPLLALAQTGGTGGGNLGNLNQWVSGLGTVVQTAIPIAFGIALLAFFWGLAKFIFSAGDEEKKEAGKTIMIWGVIALFLMASIWGIIALIGSNLGVNQTTSGTAPTINNLGGGN